MSSKNPAQRTRDIADNIDAIAAFTAGMELEAFAADRKTLYAVVRSLEIVSEASRRLPAELKDRHPESTGSQWLNVTFAAPCLKTDSHPLRPVRGPETAPKWNSRTI